MKKSTLDVMDADEYRSFINSYYGADSDAAALLGNANTNWQDEIYRTAISHDHNVTISGGLKNMPYRVSLGYTNQDGILKTSDFERYTASVNVNPSFLDDHLKVNVNVKGMVANTRYANTGAISAATRMDPTQSIYSTDSKYNNFGGYFQWLKDGGDLNDPTWAYTSERNAVRNPVAMLEQYNDKAKSKSLI
jgi:iron complex outermembrane receptor protein